MRASRKVLNLPLVVLSAGISRPGLRGEIRRELQRDLATLSTEACHVIAEESGHGIGGDQPDLVAQAIRAVVEAVRDPESGLDCTLT